MTEKKIFKNIEKTINECFYKKYRTDESLYNKYNIENLLFNEKSHLVALFKDNLIINEDYEFCKRFYKIKESIKRLIKYTAYYQKFNYIFPNYSILPESEYLYQNINGKQRIIDEQKNKKKKEILINENQNQTSSENNDINNNNEVDINKTNKIFNSNVYDSILKNTNNSCTSQFGIEINKEKIDSIGEIKNLITEINNIPSDINNIVALNDSPARPMHNNIFIKINKKDENNKENENNNNNEIKIKKFNKNKYNTNYCYDKFKNRNINNLLYNFNNNVINTNSNTPQSKNTFCSPFYNKIKLKISTLSNIPNINTNNTIKNINKKNININNNNIIINNNSNNTCKNKQSFIYRKLSPMNKIDKLSFSIKNNINNKESLRTTNYCPSTTKSSNNGINIRKKYSSKFEIISYEKIKNKINFTNKNGIKNNINNQNLYINNTQTLNNKFLYAKRRANSEINCNLKINNCINYMPRENTVYIFNDNSNLQNYNIYNKNNQNLNTIQHKTKSLSIKKNSINNVIKPYITEGLIDYISNKIKRECQNYISKRIFNIINNNSKKKNTNSSKKNTSISLKKYFVLNKKKKNNINNKHSINNKINKEISSIENNNFYSRDTFEGLTFNSNVTNNIIHINRVPIYNTKKKHFNNNFITPNSIKKHISFKQYLNNNFSSISSINNNTYNCKLSISQNINKINNNTLYSIKTNIKNNYNSKNNNKYVYDINNINNKKLKTISSFRNKKLVINTEDKKKILIIKKKENKINTNKHKNNKNIIIINNNSNNNKLKINKNGILNNNNNNYVKIKEYEKKNIIEPKRGLYKTNIFKLNNKLIKKNVYNNIIEKMNNE